MKRKLLFAALIVGLLTLSPGIVLSYLIVMGVRVAEMQITGAWVLALPGFFLTLVLLINAWEEA